MNAQTPPHLKRVGCIFLCVLHKVVSHLSFQRAAALQRTTTKEAFVPAVEMDQNVMHSAYQSAINLKDIVKNSVVQSMEKKEEGTVSLGKLAFSAFALS